MKRYMIIFLAAVFLLGWFSQPTEAQAPRKVKMTIPVVAHSMTPVYIAQSKNFFADEKLEIDITSTGGGGPDIRALIVDLKQRYPNAKIYLIGTSRGTISAAALAAKLGDSVQGVALSSSVTNSSKVGEGLSHFDFKTIRIPLLAIHHRDDACSVSPYHNVERISNKQSLISVSGGDPLQSGPCDSQSPHGYFGRDAAVVQAIKNWMLGRDFAREIG